MRLIPPHTRRPAPRQITMVLSRVTAVFQNSIRYLETQTLSLGSGFLTFLKIFVCSGIIEVRLITDKQFPAGGPIRQTERPLHKLQWPLCNHAVLVYWNPGQKCPLTRMSRRGILNIEKVLPIDGQPLVISVYAIDRIPLPRGRSFAFIDFFGDFESQADRSQNNSDKSDHYRQFFHIHCPPFFRLEGRALRRGLTAYRY